jgi:hypothetical protein
VAFLMAVHDQLELWDCPETILAAKTPPLLQCTATRAPSIMSSSLPEMTRDPALLDAVVVRLASTSCAADAWEVSIGGWTWLVQRSASRTWARPAHGLAGCVDGHAVTYRSGRIDEFDLDWTDAEQRRVDLP